MHTSNPRHETRDAVLITITGDMVARTSMSQDGFAERLNVELNLRAPERCRVKDYPDLKALEGAATSHVDYARIYKNWGRRVERWLDGDVEIPAWIEKSRVQALEQPWREHALLELFGRYGLLPVRPVVAKDMDAMKVFGALMRRLGDVAGVGTRVFGDMVLDARDGQFLPDPINALDSTAAKCTTLSRMAKLALAGEGWSVPSFQINNEERETFRGLPMLTREIYVFALRPFMDFATDIVGERRGISWKSIAEELYVEPHQGVKGGEPSEEELRRALVWLQKVGLVDPNLTERCLIFKLPKALQDQSVRKEVGTKWTDEAGSYVGGSEPSNYAAFPEKKSRYVGGGESEKVGTPPVSGNNHTIPNVCVCECPADPATAGQWCRFFTRGREFQIHAVQTARTMPLLASQVERGVTAEQMLVAMKIAGAKLGAPPGSPLYYRGLLNELLLERHRMAAAPHAEHCHEQTDGRNAEGQAGHHAAKRGLLHRQGPRSAVDRVNAIVAANEAARQATGTALGEGDRDVRASLDIEFWRQPEP